MKLTTRQWTALGTIAGLIGASAAVFALLQASLSSPERSPPITATAPSDAQVSIDENNPALGAGTTEPPSVAPPQIVAERRRTAAIPPTEPALSKPSPTRDPGVSVAPSASAAIPPPAGPASSADLVERPSWVRKPSDAEIRYAYPEEAMPYQLAASVVLECEVEVDMTVINCEVQESTTPGYGFEDAALRLTRKFRLHPLYMDNSPVARAKVRIPISFKYQ